MINKSGWLLCALCISGVGDVVAGESDQKLLSHEAMRKFSEVIKACCPFSHDVISVVLDCCFAGECIWMSRKMPHDDYWKWQQQKVDGGKEWWVRIFDVCEGMPLVRTCIMRPVSGEEIRGASKKRLPRSWRLESMASHVAAASGLGEGPFELVGAHMASDDTSVLYEVPHVSKQTIKFFSKLGDCAFNHHSCGEGERAEISMGELIVYLAPGVSYAQFARAWMKLHEYLVSRQQALRITNGYAEHLKNTTYGKWLDNIMDAYTRHEGMLTQASALG